LWHPPRTPLFPYTTLFRSPVIDRDRVRRHLGQLGGLTNPPRLPARPPDGLYLRGIRRRTWFRRCFRSDAAILYSADAFNTERANGARPRWHVRGYGCGSCAQLPYPGQHRHGGWLYASHRNTPAIDELWRLFCPVYVFGARYRDERPHAPLCELRVEKRQGECRGAIRGRKIRENVGPRVRRGHLPVT